MRRIQRHYIPPFGRSHGHGTTRWAPRDDELGDDTLYAKVQQVRWENAIIWGFEHGAKSEQANDDHITQEVEEEGGDSLRYPVEAEAAETWSKMRVCRNSAPAMSTESRPHAHTSSSSAYQSNGDGKRQRLTVTAADTIWLPFDMTDEIDMTKPRQYRWEISTNDNGGSKVQRNVKESQDLKRSDCALIAGLPCPLNKELDDGSWLAAVGWNSTQDMPKSKLILDDNNVPPILTNVDDFDFTSCAHEQVPSAGKTQMTLQEEKNPKSGDSLSDALKAFEPDGAKENGSRLSNSNTKKASKVVDTDTKNGNRVMNRGKTNASKRKYAVEAFGHAHHSLPAIKLSMTKPELLTAELREFHRPRSKFKINERMVFSPPPVVPVPPVEEGAVVTQIKESSDLNLTAGGKIIMVEYTEQNPPMLSNPGMASRILHYWRPPDDEEETTVGKKKMKKAKPKAPEMKMGQVITLGHHDETPFVGDVPPGRVVTSLNSKLFKVPIFQHKPVPPFALSTGARESGQYELFLLSRSVSKGKKGAAIGESAKTTLHIFEMPDLFLAGQIEPQIEVPTPNSRSANDFIRPYMSFHILRLFEKVTGRLKLGDIEGAFPSQVETTIRKRMKEFATFKRAGTVCGAWERKYPSKSASTDEIVSKIPPESVCLYESMMAGQCRLVDLGLTKHFTTKGVEAAIGRLLKRLQLRKEMLSTALTQPREIARNGNQQMEDDVWRRDTKIRKLENDIRVARFISDELQLTPWNLTQNYVECHLRGKGLLALGGIGDPSGRGEGFSFVRVPHACVTDSQPQSSVKSAVASIYGTSADLRKLKMKEAGNVLRNLGVPQGDIAKLKRWDRIRKLRELSNVAHARGKGGALSKFARGARKSLSAQQQDYRRKCDVIYERQMNVLSATIVSFSDDEESDDDSDIIDKLEDELLGAGSFGKDDHEKIVKFGPKSLFTKDGGGLNRSKEALAEREDAVELERLMNELKEDSGALGLAVATDQVTRCPDTPSKNRSRVRGRKVLKRTTRVVEEDGTETVRIEFIVDDKQVARFQAKQHRQDRLQKADERNLLRKRKRALALEHDAPGSNSLDVAKRRRLLPEELKPHKGAGVRCTQCGQVGYIRTNRSCPLYMADGGGGVTSDASGPGKKVRKSGSDEVEKITVNLTELREGARKHEAEKKRKRIQEQKEQAEMYKRPYANTVAKQSRSRMPVSHLNGNLSVVIEKLMDMPESELFRAAVDGNAVKDYYMIIKQPMDLGAIKKKIDDVQYDSMRDFIKDLELIVNNSKIYNGDPARSLITANAVKILKRAQEELATLNAEGGTPTSRGRTRLLV